MANLFNIVAASLRGNNFRVMLGKIVSRFEEDGTQEAVEWAKNNAIQTEKYCSNIDANIWGEAKQVAAQIEKNSREILEKIPVSLGGGGDYPLIYFLIRSKKPEIVFETGVAAGWSTETILQALVKNQKGKLFSSDFPYFRLKNPEQHIGILVSEGLKDRWRLDIRGDEVAVPDFVKEIGASKLDLLHYDSDKSYRGRSFAMSLVESKFADDATFVMDDIQDNLFFRDYVEEKGLNFSVLEFDGKYVGVVENIGSQLALGRQGDSS